MANILEILTNQARSTLESSASLAISSKNPEISSLHFLWAEISGFFELIAKLAVLSKVILA